MSEWLKNTGERLKFLGQWGMENHPGKMIGSLAGFFLAISIIFLGLWQTILLIALTLMGYYFGKCWDDGEPPAWLLDILHRISFWRKN